MWTLLFNDHIITKQASGEKKKYFQNNFQFHNALYIIYNPKRLIQNYHNKIAS